MAQVARRIEIFVNDTDPLEELEVTFEGSALHLECGGETWTGCRNKEHLIFEYPVKEKAILNEDRLFFLNSWWSRLDLEAEFADTVPPVSNQSLTISDHDYCGGVALQCSTEGAKLDGIPQLQVATFEDLFGRMKVKLPDQFRQNLLENNLWASPANLLQKYVLAAGLAGRDLQCHAPAGSGQTLAFLMPMLVNMMQKLPHRPRLGKSVPDTLVLCHTRESAMQSHQLAFALLKGSAFRSVCLHGRGERGGSDGSVRRQIAEIIGADVMVATPSRLFSMVSGGVVCLKQTFGLVLTDASCMMDMGMGKDIQHLLQSGIPDKTERMSMTFTSCFLSKDVQDLKGSLLHQPVVVYTSLACSPARDIQTEKVELSEKPLRLIKDIDSWPRQAGQPLRLLVWVNSRSQARALDEKLFGAHIPSAALHASVDKHRQQQIWRKFLQGQIQVIVSTDHGVKTMDISGIDSLHYDLPSTEEMMRYRFDRRRAGESRVIIYVTSNPARMDDLAKVVIALPDMLRTEGVPVPDWLRQGALQLQEDSPAARVRDEQEHLQQEDANDANWSSHNPQDGADHGWNEGWQNREWTSWHDQREGWNNDQWTGRGRDWETSEPAWDRNANQRDWQNDQRPQWPNTTWSNRSQWDQNERWRNQYQ